MVNYNSQWLLLIDQIDPCQGPMGCWICEHPPQSQNMAASALQNDEVSCWYASSSVDHVATISIS